MWALAIAVTVLVTPGPAVTIATPAPVRAAPGKESLRDEVAPVTPGRLADPHVRFFVERNSGHFQGDELCCLAPLTRANFTPAAFRVIGPEPAVRNLKIGDVYLAENVPTPTYSQTLVGLFTGQLGSDVKSVMTSLQQSYETMLDDAIKLVNQRQGTNITRDDFVFKNWNPAAMAAKYVFRT